MKGGRESGAWNKGKKDNDDGERNRYSYEDGIGQRKILMMEGETGPMRME